MKRPHHHTAVILLVCIYVGAMLFFAIIRAFGLLWFQAEYQYTSLSPILGAILLFAFYWFDWTVKLKTVSSFRWGIVILSAFLISAVVEAIFVFFDSFQFMFPIELALLFGIPLIASKNKKHTILATASYFFIISAYQLMMIFGRGYPFIAKYSPSWQILVTIDYRMFLIGLLLLKGVFVDGKYSKENLSREDGRRAWKTWLRIFYQ